MKKLFALFIIVAGSCTLTSAYSQVRVDAQIGIYERDFPGYTYYSYPAWHGHYHDRYYYQHYRPVFEREHRGYFRGRRFDHARFERDRRMHKNNGYRSERNRNNNRGQHRY